MIKVLVTSTLLFSSVVANAAQTSFFCMTKDKSTYIDVVSTGGNRALVQINGGNFLDGEAEFIEPTLYVYVPLTQGVFVLAFDVKKNEAGYAARTADNKQSEELFCKFRN